MVRIPQQLTADIEGLREKAATSLGLEPSDLALSQVHHMALSLGIRAMREAIEINGLERRTVCDGSR